MSGAEIAALTVMAVATFATRFAGPYLVDAFPDPERITRQLDRLATSILAAIIVPAALGADVARAAGVAAAIGSMLLIRRVEVAMLVAASTTAIMRLAG